MKKNLLLLGLFTLAALLRVWFPSPARVAPAETPASEPNALPSAAAAPDADQALTPGNPAAQRWNPPAPSSRESVAARLIEEIGAALASAEPLQREQVYTNLLPALILCDALRAAEVVERAEPDAQEDLLRCLMQVWTAQDAPAALTWARQDPNVPDRSTALGYACVQVAQADPAEALRVAQGLQPQDRQPGLLENLAQQWAARDLPAALGWAQSLPPGTERDNILAHVAFEESQSMPLEAARLVCERIPPGDRQVQAALSVLHQWARLDLAGAGAWASQFPAGAVRERALNEVAAVAALQQALAEAP